MDFNLILFVIYQILLLLLNYHENMSLIIYINVEILKLLMMLFIR